MARKNPGIAGLDDRIINVSCTPEMLTRNMEAIRKALGDLNKAPNILNDFGQIDVQDATIENLSVNNINGVSVFAAVALVPCNATIPARSGTSTGWQSCCLYVLVAPSEGSLDRTLVPVVDSHGAKVRVVVYNIYSSPVGPGFVKINADEDGNWLNDTPPASEGSNTTTTTTSTTTTEFPRCTGQCRWIWHGTGRYWQLDSQTCAPDPDNTTTTTTTSTSTTCECAVDLVEYTTTTTTSTTTTPDCDCLYPDFCGDAGGECTYTYCASGYVTPQISCTSTTSTSTTCDCATTTTSTSTTQTQFCRDGCRWGWIKLPGATTYRWVKISDNCSSSCPCAEPELDGVAVCEDAITPCTPDDPVVPSCTGGCLWMWFVDVWVLLRSLCIGPSEPCVCVRPSAPGTRNCESLEVGCQWIPPEEDDEPCAYCYTTTTTSTTSTTTTGCDGYCLFNWSVMHNRWVFKRTTCSQDCPCGLPSFDGSENCEYARVPCGENTTTSTTSTTTTAECTGQCVWECANFGGGNYRFSPISSNCSPGPNQCGCPPLDCWQCVPADWPDGLTLACCPGYDRNGDCDDQIPCNTSTTTTTTTTTTTSTTSTTTTVPPEMGACCCPAGFGFPPDCSMTTEIGCGCEPRQATWYSGQTCEEVGCADLTCTGECLWASDGFAWYQFTFCDSLCDCEYPAVAPTMGGSTSTPCVNI